MSDKFPPFKRQEGEDLIEFKRRVIGEAIGAGSACWDNLPGAGVFQSDRAAEILQAAAYALGIPWREDNDILPAEPPTLIDLPLMAELGEVMTADLGDRETRARALDAAIASYAIDGAQLVQLGNEAILATAAEFLGFLKGDDEIAEPEPPEHNDSPWTDTARVENDRNIATAYIDGYLYVHGLHRELNTTIVYRDGDAYVRIRGASPVTISIHPDYHGIFQYANYPREAEHHA